MWFVDPACILNNERYYLIVLDWEMSLDLGSDVFRDLFWWSTWFIRDHPNPLGRCFEGGGRFGPSDPLSFDSFRWKQVVRRGMSQPGPAGRLMFQSWCCDVIEELTFDDSTIIYTYHIYNYIYNQISSFLAHWPTGIYQDLPGKVTYSVLRWPRPNRNGRTWSRDLESWWPSIYVFTTWRAKNIWITPPIQRISFLPES